MVEEDAKAFISNLEAEKGGKVGYRTYATWFSDGDNVREFGVFVYLVNGIFYYRDFERKPNILGFEIKKRKNAPEYVMLEGSFDKALVRDVYKVTLGEAMRNRPDPRRANWLARLLFRTVSAIRMDDKIVYLELIDQREFIKQLDK
ncbi:MAG: hypothetical protein WCR70_08770 [Sphaerochaetaceae bacterium]|jgi:hypothetical protein